MCRAGPTIYTGNTRASSIVAQTQHADADDPVFGFGPLRLTLIASATRTIHSGVNPWPARLTWDALLCHSPPRGAVDAYTGSTTSLRAAAHPPMSAHNSKHAVWARCVPRSSARWWRTPSGAGARAAPRRRTRPSSRPSYQRNNRRGRSPPGGRRDPEVEPAAPPRSSSTRRAGQRSKTDQTGTTCRLGALAVRSNPPAPPPAPAL